MGSLISEGQLKTVSGHVDDAASRAPRTSGGNARPDIGPLLYEPTVLTDVTSDMECANNETFGPRRSSSTRSRASMKKKKATST